MKIQYLYTWLLWTDRCLTIKEICAQIWTLDLKRRITQLKHSEVSVFVLLVKCVLAILKHEVLR